MTLGYLKRAWLAGTELAPKWWNVLLFLTVWLGCDGVVADRTLAAVRDDVFTLFAQHIRRQVDIDKRAFVQASTCTQWFYKRQQHKPSRPPIEGVAWSPAESDQGLFPRRILSPSDCDSRYPGGLESVRDDFSQTQSSLSLSLTFYEFALVGDRDDDGTYSEVELRDILRSLDLSADPPVTTAMQAVALNAKFDTVHQARGLDTLMGSMGMLYEQGYRLTAADRAELNRVME
ncbi:MAG: hypothetical protein ACT4OO_15955 [Nitrospiraceae bacterium]